MSRLVFVSPPCSPDIVMEAEMPYRKMPRAVVVVVPARAITRVRQPSDLSSYYLRRFYAEVASLERYRSQGTPVARSLRRLLRLLNESEVPRP